MAKKPGWKRDGLEQCEMNSETMMEAKMKLLLPVESLKEQRDSVRRRERRALLSAGGRG